MKLSAVVLTKNEESNLERCLRSLSFCDEIITIDDNSEDRTQEIAQKYKTTIVTRPLNNNFSEQRNFGMEHTSGDWILFVDADEEVSTELAEEIKKILTDTTYSVFSIRRRDFWWGRELCYGETMKVRNNGLIRLVKRGSGLWKGEVHEEFKSNQPSQRLHAFLNHFPHPSIKEFLKDINFYSSLRAQELFKKNKTTSSFEIIMYPLGKFLLTYFLKRGFLDGPAGFAYAFFMSFHSFLVRAKLYQYTTFHETY
jgi:glycosyltransferase involved in cell wall biosynthesis